MARKILIVDDEQVLLYLLRVILKTEGFKVLTTADPHQALKLVDEDPPDLVIIDIKMPEIDGWQLCQTLRNKPDLKSIPIIILSIVKPDEKDKDKIKELEISEYITKPFEPLTLLAVVKRILR